MPATPIGTPVFAVLKISEEDGEVVMHSFGEGTYQGLSSDNKFGISNPKIQLNNGDVVWGYECWWGTLDRLESFKTRYGVKRTVQVGVADAP